MQNEEVPSTPTTPLVQQQSLNDLILMLADGKCKLSLQWSDIIIIIRIGIKLENSINMFSGPLS